MKAYFFCFLIILLSPAWTFSFGNETIGSYVEAKHIFDTVIYRDHRVTIYCGFSYDRNKDIYLPEDFIISSFPTRAAKMEREHVVPVENFGRAFVEWREGSPRCVDNQGKSFKGRKCAETASERFRMMEADLHNIFPSVGCVNAARRNFNFEELGSSGRELFGSACPIKFSGRKVEPPARAKGVVARAYLYMDWAYPEYRMSHQQKRLMETWDTSYPPDDWECERNRRIKDTQGNGNPFVDRKCH